MTECKFKIGDTVVCRKKPGIAENPIKIGDTLVITEIEKEDNYWIIREEPHYWFRASLFRKVKLNYTSKTLITGV